MKMISVEFTVSSCWKLVDKTWINAALKIPSDVYKTFKSAACVLTTWYLKKLNLSHRLTLGEEAEVHRCSCFLLIGDHMMNIYTDRADWRLHELISSSCLLNIKCCFFPNEWFSLVLSGSLWFSVVLCGSLWFSVVLSGSLWFSLQIFIPTGCLIQYFTLLSCWCCCWRRLPPLLTEKWVPSQCE